MLVVRNCNFKLYSMAILNILLQSGHTMRLAHQCEFLMSASYRFSDQRALANFVNKVVIYTMVHLYREDA